MSIDATDFSHVLINGKDAGHLIDAVCNNPDRRAELKSAFDHWLIGHNDETALLRTVAAQQVLDAQADRDAKVEEAQAQADALGTKEEAQAIRKAKELSDIDRMVADLVAKKAELSK